MSTIVENKCLSPELSVESVDDILNKIDLSVDSIRDRPKHKLSAHLMFALIMLCFISTQRKTRSHIMSKQFQMKKDIRRQFGLFFSIFEYNTNLKAFSGGMLTGLKMG